MPFIAKPIPTLRFFTVLGAVALFAGCGGSESSPAADSAAAAAPPPPPAELFTLAGDDASWTAEITAAAIVWRKKRGARTDSVLFDYKPPTINGAFYEFESLRTAEDTTRISISLAMTKCTDKAGAEYTHMAKVWLTGKVKDEGTGCANKK